MVHKTAKGKFLGRDKKLSLVGDAQTAVSARVARDDKRWRRRLAKLSGDKKEQYKALGKVSCRGVTRRAKLRATQKGVRKPDQVAYECTIHLAKLLKGRTFHKRAPTAVKKIRAFAHRIMRTKDNRIDAELNTALWANGIKGVPGRIRVKIQRKVEQQEGEKKKGSRKHLYTVITHVPVSSLKGLTTQLKQ